MSDAADRRVRVQEESADIDAFGEQLESYQPNAELAGSIRRLTEKNQLLLAQLYPDSLSVREKSLAWASKLDFPGQHDST